MAEQTEDSEKIPECYTNEKSLLNRMVGKTNESTITVNGQLIKALIDTGSDITMMSDKCFFSVDPRPELRRIKVNKKVQEEPQAEVAANP